MENEIAYFHLEELTYISNILRAAFDIRTINGEEDEILGDFIQALDDGVTISVNEGD